MLQESDCVTDSSNKMTNDSRWVGVGRSAGPDATLAAEQAVGDAVQGRSAKLVVLFASEALDLQALVARAYQLADGAPLVGCSTAGEIASGGPSDGGVVALAFGGDGFTIGVRCTTGLGDSPREAGAEAASVLSEVAGASFHILMLLTDGLAGDQQEVVRGAHSVAGAGVPLVGGCAGDDLQMAATHQFFNGEVLRDAVVVAGIGSEAPLGIGVRHGWEPVGDPMLVTESGPNRVDTLDDQPALDIYLDRLNAPPETRTVRLSSASRSSTPSAWLAEAVRSRCAGSRRPTLKLARW